MKQLYFCRHGLSLYGHQGVWAGSSNPPLTNTGRQEAKAAGERAKKLGITHIISSPLDRAKETAVIIAKEIGYQPDKIVTDRLVVERDFGELEGAPFDPHINMEEYKGVEPLAELLDRASKVWKHLQNLDTDVILIVSHGSFGRALRHIIDPAIPFRGSAKFENAEIVRLY